MYIWIRVCILCVYAHTWTHTWTAWQTVPLDMYPHNIVYLYVGCIRCIDLQVSFRKRASNKKGVLRKVSAQYISQFDVSVTIRQFVPCVHVCAYTHNIHTRIHMYLFTHRALCPEPASIHVIVLKSLLIILKSQLTTQYSVDIYTGWRGCMDALICRSLSAKEPLMRRGFCGKWPEKIRHPMRLCHPIL